MVIPLFYFWGEKSKLRKLSRFIRRLRKMAENKIYVCDAKSAKRTIVMAIIKGEEEKWKTNLYLA